jgi:NAD-dependent dihydropyrimidine dehydrogenase PreA subunit
MQEKHESSWTVILSGDGHESLADCLVSRCGLSLLAIPDLYDLGVDHLALAAMQEITGPICFVSNYLPRAAYWLLHWHGIRGRRADFKQTHTTGRRIAPIGVAGCQQDEAVRRVLAVTGSVAGRGSVRSVVDHAQRRWFPIIDYDRCTRCLACTEFCLFGVYEAPADKPVCVKRPQHCKPGCPACSWTCPAGAIMFPRYAGSGPVAGEDTGLPPRLQGDDLRKAAGKSIGRWSSDKTSSAREEVLDKTIDELESF